LHWDLPWRPLWWPESTLPSPRLQQAMGGGFETEYKPDPKRAAVYAGLYERYQRFGKFVEEESNK